MTINKQKIIEEISQLISQDKDFANEFDSIEDKAGLVAYHLSLGRYIRNTYKLWEIEWVPELDEDGVDISENHPDFISMQIIEEIWEKNKI